MIKQAIAISIMLLTARFATAADCQDIPSCASLGFGMNINQCSGKPVLRCPFDKTADGAVWCSKGGVGPKCISGNYFNMKTKACYPKGASDYVFINDVQDTQAEVLDLSNIKLVHGKNIDDFIKFSLEKDVITSYQFYRVHEYISQHLEKGCYIVAGKPQEVSMIFINDNGIATKIDASSFQKYCFLTDTKEEGAAQARVLKYKVVEYR